MRIKDLSLIDYRSSVKIDRVSFDRLNVLVGVSGAGKTTIISGLKKLITIAEGEKAIGLEWELSFLDDLDRKISWIGKLSQGTEVDSNGKTYSKFINELLTIDGETLFSRNEKEIIFSGMTLPRLDEDKSLLFQFRSSDELKAVFNSLVSTVIVSVDSNLFSNNLSVPLIE
ncbi:ATP-binding cassette domain-containing protein [Aliivibrio wodanis]|uniref:ATP-binding cassette domain-containing protein n=1 Tax=Aliivibrio wodanis TaxID=80852 RepID=UPI00406C95A7